jgi:hypothetical protein
MCENSPNVVTLVILPKHPVALAVTTKIFFFCVRLAGFPRHLSPG